MADYKLLTPTRSTTPSTTLSTGSPTMSSSPTSGMFMVRLVRFLYGIVLIFGLMLAAVTIHGMKPVTDPVTPVGILDKLSFFMGIHDRTTVTVLDLDEWSTTVYTYVFHHHLNDGSFHLAEEKKTSILPGLFGVQNETVVDFRVQGVLDEARSQQPPSRVGFLRLRPTPGDVDPKIALVARVSNKVTNSKAVGAQEISMVLRRLQLKLVLSSDFRFSADGVGTLGDISDERALQWFAVNLMTQRLQREPFNVKKTAVIVDVGERDVNVTLAVPYSPGPGGKPRILKGSALGSKVVAVKRLSAFGHPVVLLTLKFEGLGLYAARKHVFTLPSSLNNTPSEKVAKEAGNDVENVYSVRNGCVNPIIDSYWQWSNDLYHVRGLLKGDTEIVKERNGPFAGKRIKRPVANFNYCNGAMVTYATSKMTKVEREQVKTLLKGRELFMEGLLKEKCVERGLTLPERGGDVKVKQLLESLKLACKVPNTDQPFACADLMFLTRLLDQFLDLQPGSLIRSSRNIRSMTAEWALGAAFYVHQNGL